MPENLRIGQKVFTDLEHSWLWAGTEHENLMSRARTGVVVQIPWAAAKTGAGTIKVRWESLTGVPIKSPEMWVHTDLIEVAP